jgi:hypothetical protein
MERAAPDRFASLTATGSNHLAYGQHSRFRGWLAVMSQHSNDVENRPDCEARQDRNPENT